MLLWVGFALGVAVSARLGIEAGLRTGRAFAAFCLQMLRVLPPAFVLIGLFEAWVSRQRVERYLGRGAGLRGHLWAVLLAGTTVGGLYVSLPVAAALHRKGAALGVVFTYLGASAICRVPMTVFEASFLGIRFTLVRFVVSLPLLLLSSLLLERHLVARGYRLPGEGGQR